MEAIAALEVGASQPSWQAVPLALNIKAYRPPVMNTIIAPSFFVVDICRAKTAGTGRMRRYQSSIIRMTPVGMEKLSKLYLCIDRMSSRRDSPGHGLFNTNAVIVTGT